MNDPHAADDAFQATFLTLARKASRLGGIESLGAWLYRVAVRVALKARRGRQAESLDVRTDDHVDDRRIVQASGAAAHGEGGGGPAYIGAGAIQEHGVCPIGV